MSRKTRWSEDRRYEIAYGHDHIMGFFIQVWDLFLPDLDSPLIEYDDGPFLGGCDAEKILETAAKYGAVINPTEILDLKKATPRRFL